MDMASVACGALRAISAHMGTPWVVSYDGVPDMLAAIPATQRVLALHPAREDVAADGCGLLADIAWADPSWSESSAINTLVTAMSNDKASETVATHACGAICALSTDYELALVAAANGLEAIPRAMADHGASAALTSSACGALRKIASDISDRDVPQCIGALLNAARAHPSSSLIAGDAIGTLWNLVNRNGDVQAAMVDAECIPVVVGALVTHAASASVVIPSCCLLKRVAGRADTRVAIAAAGGIKALLGALKAHPSRAHVAASVCGAVTSLAADDHACTAVAIPRGIPSVVAALWEQMENEEARARACSLLGLPAAPHDELISEAFAASGGIEAVIEALGVQSSALAVAASACARAIADAVAVPRLVGILQDARKSIRTRSHSLFAISHLARHSKYYHQAIEAAGRIAAIFAALTVVAGPATR